MAQQNATDFLDPESISQGKHLGMMTRQVVEGYRVGEHRSPFRGFAIEFSQHREYVPGDDTRHAGPACAAGNLFLERRNRRA